MLLTPAFTDYAIEGSARAGMPKVNREHLFAFRVALPSVQEQKLAAARLDALAQETQRLVDVYERKLTALDELKKSLLHIEAEHSDLFDVLAYVAFASEPVSREARAALAHAASAQEFTDKQ